MSLISVNKVIPDSTAPLMLKRSPREDDNKHDVVILSNFSFITTSDIYSVTKVPHIFQEKAF